MSVDLMDISVTAALLQRVTAYFTAQTTGVPQCGECRDTGFDALGLSCQSCLGGSKTRIRAAEVLAVCIFAHRLQATTGAPFFRALLAELDAMPENETLMGPGALSIRVGQLRAELRALLAPAAPPLPLRLAEIEARANAATPGPWEAEADDGATMVYQRGEDTEICRLTKNHKANAAFIAHAREDVPALIAEIRRLQAALQNKTSTYDCVQEGYCIHDGQRAEAPALPLIVLTRRQARELYLTAMTGPQEFEDHLRLMGIGVDAA